MTFFMVSSICLLLIYQFLVKWQCIQLQPDSGVLSFAVHTPGLVFPFPGKVHGIRFIASFLGDE